MNYRTKVLLFLLAAVGLTGSVLLWLSHRNASGLVFRLIQEKVLAIAVSVGPQIDGDAHEELQSPEQDGNADYLKVRDVLRSVRDANQRGDIKVAFVYTIRPVAGGGDGEDGWQAWEYVVDAEEEGEDKSAIGDVVEFREGEEIIPKLGQAKVDATFAEDSFGKWLTAFAPVRDSSGKDVAMVGVDIEAAAVTAQLNSLLRGGVIALALAFLAAAFASYFLARRATAPLKALEEKVLQIGSGDLSARAPVESDDEFGKLAVAVNFMAAGLQEREAFKGALVRFVSGRDAEEVARETARQAEDTAASDDAGHQAARRVTVMAVALQGFDSAFRSVAAEQVSAFLSEWYAEMIDLIVSHRGSLEKSSGQTITATFGAQLSDSIQERHAIETALTMQQDFSRLRDRWHKNLAADIDFAVVIHSGSVGLLPGEDRAPDGQAMDAVALNKLLVEVTTILESESILKNGIAVSETTASGLRGTLPLGELPPVNIPADASVSASAKTLALHSVEMPLQDTARS